MITQAQFAQLLQEYAQELQSKMAEPRPEVGEVVKRYRASFKLAVEFLELNIRDDDGFNLALMGAPDVETRETQRALIKKLHHFLDVSIQIENNNLNFNPNAAPGAKAILIDPFLPPSNRIYVYDAPQNLSVREKYTRGLLTANHWLTELDMQRMVNACDAEIKILPFTRESITAALQLMMREHAEAVEPYTVPLLLQKPRTGNTQGVHWLAAKITVNPNGRTIHYQIDDSLQLNEAEKANYQNLIEDAIKLNADFNSAGWSIDGGSQVRGSDRKNEDYSNGYRALNFLLRDPDIRGNNAVANQYNIVAESSEDLVRAFYKQQLQDLEISREISNALGAQASSRFKPPVDQTAKIKEDALADFLTHLPKQAVGAKRLENDVVGNFVRSYQANLPLMRFPPGLKDALLGAMHYEELFEKLAQVEGLSANPLPRFILSHADNATLDGLNAFYANNQANSFKTLQIDIDLAESDDLNAFVAKLNFALKNLSHSNLSHIILNDEKNLLTQEHIKTLQSFIESQKIAIAIDLPESLRETAAQRQLDQSTDINRRLKNSERLAGKTTTEATNNSSNAPQVKRQRKRIDLRLAKNVDTELQEGVEADVVVESEVQKKRVEVVPQNIKVLKLEELSNAVLNDNFEAFHGTAHGLKKEALVAQWHKVFGNIVHGKLILGQKKSKAPIGNKEVIGGQVILVNHELSGISTAAFAKINEQQAHFANGINIHQLPPGFVLVSDPQNPKGQVLHYDAHIEQLNSIAPKLPIKAAGQPLSIDLVEHLLQNEQVNKNLRSIWQALQSSESYSRENNRCFRQYLPELMNLSEEQLTKLMMLCGEADAFNFNTLKFIFQHLNEAQASYVEPYNEAALVDIAWMSTIFPSPEERERFITLAHSIQPRELKEHPLLTLLEAGQKSSLLAQLSPYKLTDGELNGLLVIYDQYGIAAIEKIANTWNEIKALQFPSIIKNLAGYEAILLGDDLLNAVKTINGFPPAQRQWWDKLYQAHQPKEDNLIDLVQCFKEFIKEAKVEFYELDETEKHFPGAINLPMTLSRMRSILDLCDQRDRSKQWAAMAQIDLSAQGALRALTDGLKGPNPCGFVIPEMAVDPKATIQDTVYDTSNDPKAIAETKGDERLRQFYRYIAHQKYRQPLSFYQNAINELEQLRASKKIPDEAVNQLYVLLLDATTGNNCHYFINDEETAIKEWNSVVNNIKNIALPESKVTEFAKKKAVSELVDLARAPALPLLATLVQLIATPLQNPGVMDFIGLPTKMERFNRSNRILNLYVEFFGAKMYAGMKFYSKGDFDNKFPVFDSEEKKKFPGGRDLFEEFLAVSEALNKEKAAGELAPLISTFKITSDKPDEPDKAEKAVTIASLGKAVKDIKGEQEFNAFNATLLNYAIELLQDINNPEELNPQKLLDFLNHNLKPVITTAQKQFTERHTVLDNKVKRIPDPETQKIPELATVEEIEEWSTFEELQEHLKNPEKLTPKDKAIIINFSKSAIQGAIKTKFQNNYPSNYFQVLEASAVVKGDLNLRINEVFKNTKLKDHFQNIREQYPEASTAELLTLVDSLETILSQLDSQSEKLQLFELLRYPSLLSSPITEYNQLVSAIAKQGHSGFIYFMEEVVDKYPIPNKSINDLTLKAEYFVSEALPRLRQDLKSSKQLNEMDVLSLATDLVLTGKGINLALIEDAKRIEAALSSAAPESVESLMIKAQTMHPELASIAALNDLKAPLEWLKKPETETVKVTKTKTVLENVTKAASGGVVNSMWNIANKLSLGVIGGATEVVTEQRTVSYEEDETRPVHKTLDSKLVSAAQEAVNEIVTNSRTYALAFSESFRLIDELVAQYPAAKVQLLPFTQNYLSFRPTTAEADANQASIAQEQLALIHKEFAALKNQDLIISLCAHFGAKDSVYNFKKLFHIFKGETIAIPNEGEFNFANYPQLNPDAKKQVLVVISSLLNNGRNCSLKDIQSLIDQCATPGSGGVYQTVLEKAFEKAPYPTLQKVNEWFTEVQKLEDKSEQAIKTYLTAQYKEWSKTPVDREDAVNGFKLDFAKTQCKDHGLNYSEKELEDLDAAVKAARKLDMDQLQQQIQIDKKDPTKLVALMAELLYRTKGQEAVGAEGGREWGRSFEINTTQYLAIHSMLKAGGHVTSQIGTGEGKSRIMMISIACQYALGRTVDFVTADVSLATRDYLEYQAFFKALGAQTNLIKANSPASEYRKGGINFSDAANLSLFRNKARSEDLGDQVIVDAQDRALMLDEADKTYFDAADTRFNYSAQADPAIRDMPWVYELMVEFFNNPENRDLYDHDEKSDADECNRQFINFARGRLLDERQIKRLEAVSVKQLEAWQGSALTALSLVFEEDFTLRSKATILTKHGPKKVSQAQLINGSRASENAKYSFGVHQCLHARLNQEKKIATELQADGKPLTTLQAQLVDKAFKHPFSIDSENQIVYSSTSKSLLDDYEEGQLLAVTGTAGSIQERNEAKKAYGANGKEMTFIDMPRHRPPQRIDFPVAFTNGQTAHQQKILAAVREAIKREQPVLLVCENDIESQELYTFLEKNLSAAEKTQLKRISAATKLDEEAEHVEKDAGKPGAITVTTAMLGRGTDIKLHGKAKDYGLSVLATYLPRERDYLQIVGRSGRFGAKGDSRLILDKERLKTSFGVDVLPSEFYTATDSYLQHQQARMDEFAQKQRVIKDAVGDFRLTLTKKFFNDFYAPVYNECKDKDTLLHSWREFFDKTDKAWNEAWPKVSEQLTREPINRSAIDEILEQYQAGVQEEWKAMREFLKTQIREEKIKCAEGEAKVDNCLTFKENELGKIKKVSDLISDTNATPRYRTKLAESYDEAYVGRAVIYKNLSDRIISFFKNIAAARRDDGPWFPNLQAARQGHMSWSQFFFGASGKALDEPKTPSSNHLMNKLLQHPDAPTPKEEVEELAHKSYISGKFFLPTPEGKDPQERLHDKEEDDLANKNETEIRPN